MAEAVGRHGARLRRAHLRRPRRPGRRRDGRASRRTIAAIRGRRPSRRDRDADLRLQGRRPESLQAACSTPGPDVLNHNVETVARLQRAVRPSAGYARVAVGAGPGQGGRADHQVGHDRGDGRDRRRGRSRPWPTWPGSASTSSPSASTCGRPPTTCPIDRWVEPATFAAVARGRGRLGIAHVGSQPATRCSYSA